LQQLYGTAAALRIQSSRSGTEVRITLPADVTATRAIVAVPVVT
jgi:hypothetical protein